jgi:pyruvate formate lyase activating enzyme
MNDGGQLAGVNSKQGKLSWYHDPLPTNCVADWVCSAGTGAGYPKYAHCPGPEYGYDNLAIFFHGCSFNCLYCQNWHFRKKILRPEMSQVEKIGFRNEQKDSLHLFFWR